MCSNFVCPLGPFSLTQSHILKNDGKHYSFSIGIYTETVFAQETYNESDNAPVWKQQSDYAGITNVDSLNSFLELPF